jgi:phosphoribosylanthranilate isomerase
MDRRAKYRGLGIKDDKKVFLSSLTLVPFNNMIKIKICGITNLEDAQICAVSGADALGFIFSKISPRCIKEKEAKKIITELEPFITKVGVFVDEAREKVFNLASNLGLDVLQFHGKETPSYCNFFRKKFKVIKVLFPDKEPFDKKMKRYSVDAFMIDIKYEDKVKGVKQLSRESLSEISRLIKKGNRIIISGGLNLGNISEVKKLRPYALDVASGVEACVGKKDKNLVRAFVKKIKK